MSLDLLSNIRTFPDTVLTLPCSPIEQFGTATRAFGQMLLDRLLRNDLGIGLAANQVGVQQSVFAWDLTYYSGSQGLIFNPAVIEGDGLVVYEEGCLSLPNFFWPVERPESVLVTGQDQTGLAVQYELSGIASRLFQHEIDHLDGKLIFDRVEPAERSDAIVEAERCLDERVAADLRRDRRSRRRLNL